MYLIILSLASNFESFLMHNHKLLMLNLIHQLNKLIKEDIFLD